MRCGCEYTKASSTDPGRSPSAAIATEAPATGAPSARSSATARSGPFGWFTGNALTDSIGGTAAAGIIGGSSGDTTFAVAVGAALGDGADTDEPGAAAVTDGDGVDDAVASISGDGAVTADGALDARAAGAGTAAETMGRTGREVTDCGDGDASAMLAAGDGVTTGVVTVVIGVQAGSLHDGGANARTANRYSPRVMENVQDTSRPVTRHCSPLVPPGATEPSGRTAVTA